ncbi:MAG TPA: class I SAM-dependent methyltransferase [Hyphomicrobium sp.]|nr:class I SAM-dependent methyltransferase [Hyphomicrobium sp.]
MNQAEHYDTILDAYERHYYDEQALRYRPKYIYPHLFEGVSLDGARVLELAWGSGLNTLEALRLFPNVAVSGLDISPRSCEAYRRNTRREAAVFDLADPQAPPIAPADHVFIVGGLHHCVRDLPTTFDNVAKLIRPGGTLLMVEPNAGFILNAIRNYWYRKDRWFREEDEAPLVHDDIAALAAGKFVAEKVTYLGGPAYFLVLNSLITRIPVGAKAFLAAATFVVDDVYNRIPGQRPFPMFIARWERDAAPGGEV